MSTRYTDHDSDSYRLPEGMQRIGYDADTQTYSFRDNNDNTIWESEPGNRYGRLHRAGTSSSRRGSEVEDANTMMMIKRAKREDWRYMAPFFLLVVGFLLVVWRFFGPSIWSSSGPVCGEGLGVYNIEKGDTCWDIAKREDITVEELVGLNEGLECDHLRVRERCSLGVVLMVTLFSACQRWGCDARWDVLYMKTPDYDGEVLCP